MDASRAPVISETSRRSPGLSDDDRPSTGTRWRLLAASTLMLFLELALIRWLGAEVLHLSYFSNFVLLGSFLGVGLGFLRAAGPTHPDRPLPLYSPVVLLGLIGAVSGLVHVFSNLGLSSGASDTRQIALGIAEALNATVFGLSIAVPTLVGFTYFSRKVEVMSVEMETLVVELINKCYYGRATREHTATPIPTSVA